MIAAIWRISYQGSPGAMARKMGPKKGESCNEYPKMWALEKSRGADRMELAKMTGMTPPELTLRGRWVDWPPIIFRPTMRLAYWTGMRRSERSTKTMKATTAI